MLPYLGFGLGLRPPHYQYILKNKPKVDWFEILTENYLVPGGQALDHLQQIAAHYPLVLHGVSLSIGSSDPLNKNYLQQVKKLAESVNAKWISDHLCWTGVKGKNIHDLLPIPYTKEAIAHIVERIKQVQDILGQQILLENVSSYVTYKASTMSEWQFLTEIAEQANCLILLDINNIYVSAFNHKFDPLEYLNYIPIERVQQFHLAGHDNQGTHIVDTHDHPIIDNVWNLYREAVGRFAQVSTMIERDDNIPEFPVLYQELQEAKLIAKEVLAKGAVAC